MHRPCTHRSVQCAFVRSINDFSTLRQQNLRRVGIECRPLRAHQDSVSADGHHQRFASPFHPSRQLHSSTRNGVNICPKREFQKLCHFFSERSRQKPRSPPHSTPLPAACLPFAFHPSTSVHPTTSGTSSKRACCLASLLLFMHLGTLLDYTAVSALLLRVSLYYKGCRCITSVCINSSHCCRFGGPFS